MKLFMIFLLICLKFGGTAVANVKGEQGSKVPTLSLDLKETDDPEDFVPAIKIVLALTVLSVAPAILLMTTSFTRIIVVLSFVRQALGTASMPPNQVIIGMALFLTYFTMSPVFDEIKAGAYDPYIAKNITQDQALDAAVIPLKKFMISQTREADMALFRSLSNAKKMTVSAESKDVKERPSELPITTIIPAFIVSELKTAFQIGFLIYVPFLVIDMVVSSVLMAMGMVMLPPVVISLPFKMVLFVLIDGWALVTENLVRSFHG